MTVAGIPNTPLGRRRSAALTTLAVTVEDALGVNDLLDDVVAEVEDAARRVIDALIANRDVALVALGMEQHADGSWWYAAAGEVGDVALGMEQHADGSWWYPAAGEVGDA